MFVMTFKRVQSAVDHLFQFAPQPGLELARVAAGESSVSLCACPVDDGTKNVFIQFSPFYFLMEIPFHSFCWYNYLSGYVLDQGSPPPEPRTSTSPWPVRNLAAQQKVSSRWNQNHTPTPPTQPRSMGKLSSVKLRPGNIKSAKCYSRQNGIERLPEQSWLGNHKL